MKRPIPNHHNYYLYKGFAGISIDIDTLIALYTTGDDGTPAASIAPFLHNDFLNGTTRSIETV
jgi:hypothetical protein